MRRGVEAGPVIAVTEQNGHSVQQPRRAGPPGRRVDHAAALPQRQSSRAARRAGRPPEDAIPAGAMRGIAAAAHQRPQRAANVDRAPGLPSASSLRHPTRTESTHRPIPRRARSELQRRAQPELRSRARSPTTASTTAASVPIVADRPTMARRTTAPGASRTSSNSVAPSTMQPAATTQPAPTVAPPESFAWSLTCAPGNTSASPTGPGTADDGAIPRTRSAEPARSPPASPDHASRSDRRSQ